MARKSKGADLSTLAQEFKRTALHGHYSRDYKRMIVYKILVEHTPVLPLSEKIGVPRQTIYNWISKFASEKTCRTEEEATPFDSRLNSEAMPRKKQESPESVEEELARLREENKQLQEALKMSEWTNHAKDVMIEIAEKTFNIPIKKKHGAKS